MWSFFFQAEDGIRDVAVTGVQTCALPISREKKSPSAPNPGGSGGACAVVASASSAAAARVSAIRRRSGSIDLTATSIVSRSEERRVGKECRSRRWPQQEKKTGRIKQQAYE